MTENPDEKCWHYVNHRGARQGPVNVRELRWAAEHGYLIRTSLVWRPNQADWMKAEEALPPEVFEGLVLPPPLPGERLQALPEEHEVIAPSDAQNAASDDGPQLLFKWLKNFTTNLKVFPARAARAGLQITNRRQPSATTNVFDGVVMLGVQNTPVRVVLAMKPIVGGIMSMNLLRSSASKEELSTLTRHAEDWFNRHWAGEKRFPWFLWAIGIAAVLVAIVSILLFEALAPGREHAALACRQRLSGYTRIETLDRFDYERAMFRPIDWHPNQARSVDGQPIKCVVVPQLGRFAYLGTCDWIGSAGSPPQTELLSCLVYFDKAASRWQTVD